MNLLDDFLFFSMMDYPEIGERFGRMLLETIFNRQFGELKVIPQRVYYGEQPDTHGIRLDVYLEAEETIEELMKVSTIFDIEPDLKDTTKNKRELPWKVRFNHSRIDARELKSGKDYDELKRVVVVMIMPFDPFGYDQKLYTIRRSCKELPEMEYDDGDETLFFYTRGTQGNVSEGVQALLNYMEDTRTENATNETLQEVQDMVDIVKGDSEVAKKVMRIDEKIREAREEERLNTERERKRAEESEARLKEALEKLAFYEKQAAK